jgi:hypothetical protein
MSDILSDSFPFQGLARRGDESAFVGDGDSDPFVTHVETETAHARGV